MYNKTNLPYYRPCPHTYTYDTIRYNKFCLNPLRDCTYCSTSLTVNERNVEAMELYNKYYYEEDEIEIQFTLCKTM